MQSFKKLIRGILLGLGLFSVLICSEQKVYALGQFGATATSIIGQPSLSGCATGRNSGSYERGIYPNNSFPRVLNGKLYIPDASSDRILVYNTFPTVNFPKPDDFIGTTSLCTYGIDVMYTPISFAYDGSNFLVSEIGRNRVLIYKDGIPSRDELPDFVIGQVAYSRYGDEIQYGSANQGGAVAANTLNAPYGMQIVNGKLILADRSNNRVLIYNSIPTTNNASAAVVIGQPDMNSNAANNGGVTAKSLSSPRSVYSDGTNLIIGDSANNRVLIFNTIPTSNFAEADVVVGQVDMIHNTANAGGVTGATLRNPYDVFVSGGKLFIADHDNHRVLIYNSVPTSNGQTADVVIGQQTMSGASANQGGARGANTLSSPSGFAISGNTIFISEYGNNRILKFNAIPTSNNAYADNVIGQVDFTGGGAWAQIGPLANNLLLPFQATYSGGKTLIHDYGNHRVLIYDGLPTTSGKSADVVVGQANMTSAATGTSATRVGWSSYVDAYGGKMLWYDRNRVLLYNAIPTANDTPANYVLGQPDFSTNTDNNGGLSAKSLLQAYATYDGTRVYIADCGNNRVLIHNSFPTSNYAAADVVVGQPDMISNTANNGGISNKSLSCPREARAIDNKLYVIDGNNNRVLVFNTIPTSNFAEADFVIGQPNMTTTTPNTGGVSAKSLWIPYSVSASEKSILISDYENNRVLLFDKPITTNYPAAVAAVGQLNFTSKVYGAGTKNFNGPRSAFISGNKLVITDSWNDRLLFFDLGTRNESVTAKPLVNTQTITLTLAATDAKDFLASEDQDFQGATWQRYSTSAPFTLSSGEGAKTVYVKYRDFANYESTSFQTQTFVDSIRPTGSILINDGASETDNPVVTLALNANGTGTEVKQMVISSNSSFSGMPWIPYATSKQFTMTSNVGMKTIFVKYKDAAGNESLVYSDTINLVTTNSSPQTEPSPTPTPTITTSNPVTGTPTITVVITSEPLSVTLKITDDNNLPLVNTEINIGGKIYTTDQAGYIRDVVISSGSYKVQATVKDSKLVNTVVLDKGRMNQEITVVLKQQKAFSIGWLILFVVLLLMMIAYWWTKKGGMVNGKKRS